jgi:hypothetical protein
MNRKSSTVDSWSDPDNAHAADGKDRTVLFHVEQILRAYFAGADPIDASEQKWPPDG